jgi:hypothetical protein
VRNRNGIADRDGWNIGGGDGFYAKIDPSDQSYAYEESQDGNVARVNLVTMEHQSVRPGSGERPQPGGGRGGRGGGYRWNWDSPIMPSSADAKTVYMGANVLFKSTDRGSSWNAISPDLTLHIDRDTLSMMGARVGTTALSRNDGVTSYGTITSVGESPMNASVLYVGTDDGQVQLTRDGGDVDERASHTGLPLHPDWRISVALRAGRVCHIRRTLQRRLQATLVSDDSAKLAPPRRRTSGNVGNRMPRTSHNLHVLILLPARRTLSNAAAC